jgi:hypothetical protein
MQSRAIEGAAVPSGESRLATRGRMCMLVLGMLAAGCGGEPSPQDPVDAASPDGFAVRGSATGVLGPVDLELRAGDDTELLAVTRDGAFVFEARLEPGTSYTVSLADPGVPCALEGGAGVIAGADATIELACTVPALASVAVSGIAPAVALVPGTTDYAVDLPLLQSAVTLTATVARAGDKLTIAGADVDVGAPSPKIVLALGDNFVDIVVSNYLGWQRSYRMNLRRAAQLAQQAYSKASNTGLNDHFGEAVAISGDTLAIAAPFEASAARGVDGDQDDNGASGSGAVYVFRRAGMVWQQEAYLKASNTGFSDNFGQSLGLSGDILAIGAPREDSAARGVDGDQDDNTAANSGAVYVFRRTGTSWQQEAYLKASNAGPGDDFGESLALAGEVLAVGAWNESSSARGVDGEQEDESAPGSGAVYVFRRADGAWQQEAYLKASNTETGDAFGYGVALSGDTLAVGAIHEDSAAQGVGGDQDDNTVINTGAVYVFRHSGTAWQQEAYIKASNPGIGDDFGQSLALSGDALAVGAPREASAAQGVNGDQADDTAPSSGAVYVFRRAGTTWQQEAYVKASNPSTGDEFGTSVALLGDILAIGALHERSAAQGLDGDQANDNASSSGAVYVFRRAGTTWAQDVYLKASNTGVADQFGRGVALSGDTLAVGAWVEDSGARGVNGDQAADSVENSGAAYIFH